MNVAQVLRSLLFHRVALTVFAILAVLAGVAGWMSTSPVYRSATTVVVIPPGGGDVDPTFNPLTNLGYEAGQLALVIGTALQSDGGKKAAVDAGGTGDFTVETTVGTASSADQLTPQLNISADASNPESARRSAQALVEYARGILSKIQLQAGAPVDYEARLVWAVEPQAGKSVAAGRTRRAGAYAVATMFAGLVLIALSDAVVERRRRRNEDRQRPGSDDDDDAAWKPADVGGAADRPSPDTVAPDGSRRRHRYRSESDSDPYGIRAASPPSTYSPSTASRPDPS